MSADQPRRKPGCPGLKACRLANPGCGHLAIVDSFNHYWEAHMLRREVENPGMYDTELAEWDAANPAPKFPEYLRAMKRSNDDLRVA